MIYVHMTETDSQFGTKIEFLHKELKLHNQSQNSLHFNYNFNVYQINKKIGKHYWFS